MTQVLRLVGYSNSYQELTVSSTIAGTVSAYLWGAGGGGGGGPDGRGTSGRGGGGGYSAVNFNVNTGDVIGIAVGGPGLAGRVGRGVGGGDPGGSYLQGLDWSSLNLLTQPGVVRYTNGAYSAFLNQYGVWNTDIGSSTFDRSESVYFPGGTYTFEGSCDNYGYVSIDDTTILSIPGFTSSVTTSYYVSSGYHTVRVVGYNTGGPGAIGVRIYGFSTCFGGGRGGSAGGSGSSGSGGGGGGATVLLLNDSVIAVAGGGGGGGGAGQYSYIAACDAPGQNTQDSGSYSGQSGQNFDGDGGGGGAGGGGWQGGNGGAERGGETTGYGGAYGASYSSNGGTFNPNGRSPGVPTSPYITAATALGGLNGISGGSIPSAGGPGLAAFEFNQNLISIKDSDTWSPVQNIYVKSSGSWNQVRAAWTKSNGVWTPIYSTNDNAPNFATVVGKFGTDPRSY